MFSASVIIYDNDVRYTDAPTDVEEAFARSVTVKDFLPPPSELVLKVSPKRDENHSFRKKVACV